ncbi:NADP-dependent malic enzyme [Escherichia coli]|uniref:NADP-dependent malic enzyme n=1 Tax=Escherichia coli TaxID=562 RepID=A0A377D425_ECOLX|nr:NADP-dependent malic enzyme [Escherichia coli]
MDDQLKQSALDFHDFQFQGKSRFLQPSLWQQRDLALAYSPGVAALVLKSKKTR